MFQLQFRNGDSSPIPDSNQFFPHLSFLQFPITEYAAIGKPLCLRCFSVEAFLFVPSPYGLMLALYPLVLRRFLDVGNLILSHQMYLSLLGNPQWPGDSPFHFLYLLAPSARLPFSPGAHLPPALATRKLSLPSKTWCPIDPDASSPSAKYQFICSPPTSQQSFSLPFPTFSFRGRPFSLLFFSCPLSSPMGKLSAFTLLFVLSIRDVSPPPSLVLP